MNKDACFLRQSQIYTALEYADTCLKMLEQAEVPEWIAQAALSNAWFRLCLVLGYTPSDFEKLTKELNDLFAVEYLKCPNCDIQE